MAFVSGFRGTGPDCRGPVRASTSACRRRGVSRPGFPALALWAPGYRGMYHQCIGRAELFPPAVYHKLTGGGTSGQVGPKQERQNGGSAGPPFFMEWRCDMATTRHFTRHINAGETIAEAIKDCTDYGKNPDKTRGGELISAYECDPATVDTEFLLSKSKYKAITGRVQKWDEDILCYQIRQSFLPGEVTPEEANRIGYELGMSWTKGNHAFIVTTHIDKAHVHNHIYYNSTSLDCTRKFRNFWNSSFAIRRVSDRICLEHGLSIVKNPKPRSKGKFKNYGEWLGNNKPPTFQEQLRTQIDAALLQKPADFAAFLSLMKAAGYEVKHGRGGSLSFRCPGQERFTRCRASTLGEGYGPEDMRAVIEGRAPLPSSRAAEPVKLGRRLNLIIDIQNRLQGKGPAYERAVGESIQPKADGGGAGLLAGQRPDGV